MLSKRIKIPETLRIGGTIYKIKRKRTIGFDSNIGGNINYNTDTMSMRKKMNPKTTESVFFHEVAHGVLKEMEFNFPKMSTFRNDETFVQELGLVLRNTFIDLLNKQDKVLITKE